MTDSTLQQLERAWRASRTVEDEAALLRERVRSGALERARLELAARLGHPAARLATEHEGAAPEPAELSALLAKHPREVYVRAALAGVEATFAPLPPPADPDPIEPRVLAEVQGWLEQPSSERLGRLAELNDELLSIPGLTAPSMALSELTSLPADEDPRNALGACLEACFRARGADLVPELRARLIPWLLDLPPR